MFALIIVRNETITNQRQAVFLSFAICFQLECTTTNASARLKVHAGRLLLFVLPMWKCVALGMAAVGSKQAYGVLSERKHSIFPPRR